MSTLFAFPVSGNSFTNIKPNNVDNDVALLPPPRKAPRHDSSSSPNKQRPSSTAAAASRTITVVLESPVTPIQRAIPALSDLVDQFIRTFLRIGEESTSFNASYQDVFNACKILVLEAHQAPSLASTLERNLKSCAVSIMRELIELDVPLMKWLDKFNERWQWWLRRLDVLRSNLLYLDSVFLIPHEERLPIRDNGLQIFTNAILESQSIHSKLENVIRQWASDQRELQVKLIDTKRIQVFVECAITLKRYVDNVEQPYLKHTSEHYTKKSESVSDYSPLEYLKMCVDDVAREEQAGKGVLREETIRMAGLAALQKLVTPHVEILTGDALSAIISARNKGLLVKLHDIVERVTSSCEHWTASPTDSLLAHYRNDIFQRVKEIVTDTANDGKMVERLLELKEFLDACMSPEWLDDMEKNDRKHIYATSEAFEKGFACRKIKPAELIAKHVDQLMRRGQKASSDAEFFAQMKRVLTLYRFSPDKDVFRTFYTRALAKRMLLGQSASDDFEKEVLKVLSEAYDAAFSDLTQMFSDLAVSKDLVDEYRKVKRGQPDRPDAALSIMVLQHSVWPVIRKPSKEEQSENAEAKAKILNGIELVLPSRMQFALDDYTTFYRERHANRRLTWAHYLGTATLTARFPSGKKELSVSLYQAAVLLLFSERDAWTVEEIEEQTLLNWTDLTLTIQSLALGRKRVLKRGTTPARTEKDVRVRKEDVFVFDDEFTDIKHKLHINSIQQNDTVEETQQAVKVIDQYRDASLDAAIVRIMKGAKTMKNQQLVNETIEAVAKHFKPEVKAIKLRIDSLIEREFVARKEGTTDTFVYLA